MAHRRPVLSSVLAVGALLSFSLASLAMPVEARGRQAGLLHAARVAAAPRTSREYPASRLPAATKVAPAVASNGTGSLVVWSDHLSSATPQILGAVLDAQGGVVRQVSVSPSPAAQSAPSVAFNGTNFFVVWEESGDIFGTRITPAGTVLDGYGIPVAISRSNDQLRSPAVGRSGVNFLVAWVGPSASPSGDSVNAKRVTAGGTVLDGPGLLIGSLGLYGGLTGGGPAIGFNGAHDLVAWSQDNCPFCGTVLGARVTSGGTVMEPGGFRISKDASDRYFHESAPSVTAGAGQFLVAWTAERCTAPQDCRDVNFDSDVLAARVGADGTVPGPDIAVAAADGFAGRPAASATATSYVVVWEDRRSGGGDVYTARVSGIGAVLDPSGIRVSAAAAAERNPAVTAAGARYVVVWESGVDILGARVDTSGVVVDAKALVVSAGRAPRQSSPDVAWDGSQVLSVWRESRPGQPDTIRAGRARPSGQVASGEGMVIATDFDLGEPAISVAGEQSLVVWPQSGKLYAVRIVSGTLLDAKPITVSPTRPGFTFPRSPAVAWNGTAYLVTWADANGATLDVFATRVSAAGTVLDPLGILVASAAGDQDVPAVASDGSGFLVVWDDTRSGTGSDIYGSHVSGTGAVSNRAGFPVSVAAGNQSRADVAWNGTSYVAVWQDGRSPASLDIYGTRLSDAGTVLDASGIPISTAADDQSRPTVARIAKDVLVVWEDRRRGTGSDLYGARVTAGGAVRDAAGVVVSIASGDDADPAATSSTGGRVIVGYGRSVAGPPYRTDRVFFRVVSPK